MLVSDATENWALPNFPLLPQLLIFRSFASENIKAEN
jgi:hypothetical protein